MTDTLTPAIRQKANAYAAAYHAWWAFDAEDEDDAPEKAHREQLRDTALLALVRACREPSEPSSVDVHLVGVRDEATGEVKPMSPTTLGAIHNAAEFLASSQSARNAAREPSEEGSGANVTGWLLEKVVSPKAPTWIKSLTFATHFTANEHLHHVEPETTELHSEALRFARKQDAETALLALDHPYQVLFRPSEHMWMAAARAVSEPSAGTRGSTVEELDNLAGRIIAKLTFLRDGNEFGEARRIVLEQCAIEAMRPSRNAPSSQPPAPPSAPEASNE